MAEKPSGQCEACGYIRYPNDVINFGCQTCAAWAVDQIHVLRAEVEEKAREVAIAIDEVEMVNKQLKAARADNDAYADMLRKERAEFDALKKELDLVRKIAVKYIEEDNAGYLAATAEVARLQAELEKLREVE